MKKQKTPLFRSPKLRKLFPDRCCAKWTRNSGRQVRLEGNIDRYRFPETSGDLTERNNAFRSVFGAADKKMILPFIAQVFLTPLNEFLRQAGHEPSFVLNYVGRTQSRKSTLAALMLSFFGSFTAASLPANFKDTANALEKKGYILNGVRTIQLGINIHFVNVQHSKEVLGTQLENHLMPQSGATVSVYAFFETTGESYDLRISTTGAGLVSYAGAYRKIYAKISRAVIYDGQIYHET